MRSKDAGSSHIGIWERPRTRERAALAASATQGFMRSGLAPSGTIDPPAQRVFFRMPNSRQQKKRVRTTERQHAENVRYRSTVRTLSRKLRDAVTEGDKDAVQAAHRDLVRWLDRAVTRGALHRNTAARRKAQATALVKG